MYQNYFYSAVLLLIIVLTACNTTPKEEQITAESIAGRWTIISAMRGENSTKMLDNSYIDFKSGEVFTSLPLIAESLDSVVHSSYSMAGDSMNCPEFKTYFKFKKRKDTLDVAFNTQGFNFVASMLKK